MCMWMRAESKPVSLTRANCTCERGVRKRGISDVLIFTPTCVASEQRIRSASLSLPHSGRDQTSPSPTHSGKSSPIAFSSSLVNTRKTAPGLVHRVAQPASEVSNWDFHVYVTTHQLTLWLDVMHFVAIQCTSLHIIWLSLLYRVLPVSHICWKAPKWQLVLFSEFLVILTIQGKLLLWGKSQFN